MEMRLLSRCIIVLIAIMFPFFAIASTHPSLAYSQVIQIVNFLANTGIASPGMTPTSVKLEFFNNASGKPCWTTTLAYQGDFTIRTGTGQNCSTPIHTITVTPIVVATLLQTYDGPVDVTIDITKYSNQITLQQNNAPVFSAQSGLVTTPGTITSSIQAQVADEV